MKTKQTGVMKNKISMIGVGAALLLCVSCGTSKQASASLDSTEWKLLRMNGEEKSEFSAEEAFTLRFSPSDSMVSGRAACNRYFGKYETEGKNRINIRTGGSTRMACPDMNLEQPFFVMLDEADGYQIKGNRLTLLKQGKESSVFESKNASPDMHTAENSLDYRGRYEGTLPAADGPGMKTVLDLRRDNTFSISRTYVDRQAVVTEGGTYAVEGNMLTLTFDKSTEYYRLGENSLRKLDNQRQEITGNLAPMYVLKKTNR